MRDHRLRAGQQPRRLAVLGFAAAVLVLTGCSEAPQQPAAVDAAPTSASASPTEEELPPLGPPDFPVPDEARTQDEAGAEAFLRYYIELINRQQAVPDGQPLRDLGPDCRECHVIAQRFDDAAAAGYKLEGGQLSITSDLGTKASPNEAEIAFIARAEAAAAYGMTGTPIAGLQYPAQEALSSGLGVVWSPTDESWLVSKLTIG
ncbi:hypothetical protein OF117_02885 [Geodermatophilus sp. YIM 151500]|uniref:DUF6318 family protein n=1 Tax=Geodermatophilus sp. YIM 151500 TaxID=2984531 RepID=UPI0021E475E7|nr:DUF6318 family protein [Geodermatophilus sp. YIM 151500]MCV2488295.1 hypothetical protein [Geodermatophilus sp. YIM 151500]